ncbi:MAG TPA: hypothetical protein PLL09_01060 [Flavobacterium sp.]|uniref:hypothetical protein n=1 Tax=unclassified Flavobacterium TaxID=196869 RepID=UPI000E9A5917|nr:MULTISPECIES: hypothetical protein [unclassified Flavobacterium]HBI00497.1 hypothetical protein [Flavobacterium sp.]HRE76389.1 hypothetical protein [Flavobacterium sp.]
MEKQKWALMKLFSLMLKNRAKEENNIKQISPDLLKYFSRKELIEIINHIYDGNIPEGYQLVDMENADLLRVIGDDFSIISYVTNKWSKEVISAPVENKETVKENPESQSNEKAKPQNTTEKKELIGKDKNS